MPASHQEAIKLPAVSGSSGKLVVEQVADEGAEKSYPGLVFDDESLPYAEAMTEFVKASRAQDEAQSKPLSPAEAEKAGLKAQKQLLRREQETLRLNRRQVRERRKQEDVAWQSLRTRRRAEQEHRQHQYQQGHKLPYGSKKGQEQQWVQLRQQRREQLSQRQNEDDQWRQQRAQLRERASQLPLVSTWIAILVITDNCTRQCLGLPLFVTGSKVTAEEVVEALRALLPPELQFLISDRGTHFTAHIFEQLAQKADFIHVLIARHRPQSNGIAERFVRTLKEWLADKSWHSEQELDLLLTQFLTDYNNRPHQGLPISGLSPNEYANRIWLF